MSAREARIPLAEAPLEGELRLVELGRHRIGLVRLGEAYHALADRCPHRGAPLCSGGRLATAIEVVDGEVTVGRPHALLRCPWHKWDFDVASGRCVVDRRLRVRTYPVSVEGDEVVVRLDRR